MKAIIHIGFHKTGTSSFQAYCRQVYSRLAEKGVLYPRAGLVDLSVKSTTTSEAGHRNFDKVFISPESEASRKLLQKLKAEAQKHEADTVVISSETFSAPRIKLSDHALDTIKDYFDEVKILAYVRRQDIWANSFYREYLCWPRKREKREFEAFCRQVLPEWLDYEKRLDRWASVFGDSNIIVRSYDDRKHKNIITDILDAIVPDADAFPKVKLEGNPSLPVGMIDFVRKLNGVVGSDEKKATTTRELFRRLEQSAQYVEMPALRSAWLQAKRSEFAASNRRIASKYGIESAKVFCYDERIDVPATVKERTLGQDELAKLLENAAPKTRRKSRPAENAGTWGISCLTNEKLSQTGSFIDYHLAIGAAKIIMFLDDPADPIQRVVDNERVKFVPCDSQFWQKVLGRHPENNAEKLSICHQVGMEELRTKHRLDWAINLDADELLYVEPPHTIEWLLSKASRQANQLIIPPLEAIFVDDSDAELFSARYFKVLRTPGKRSKHAAPTVRLLKRAKSLVRAYLGHVPIVGSRLSAVIARTGPSGSEKRVPLKLPKSHINIRPWKPADASLYAKAMPIASDMLRDGFLAHRQGRVATSKGVELDIVKSHRHYSSVHTIVQSKTRGLACILHYDAVDYEAWLLKWHRRVFGGANVHNIGEERKKQQDMFLKASKEGTTRKLFRDLFFLPKEWLEPFVRQHLIVQITPPGIAEISAKWRRIEAQEVKSTKPELMET